MDYVILILLLAVVVFFVISFGLIMLGTCSTNEEIEMREEIDIQDLTRKKRDANFVLPDELTKIKNSNEGDITNDV